MSAFITTAVLVVGTAVHVLASEPLVIAGGQSFEVALPGTGSHFASATQGMFLAEGSEVRTGKTGWVILRLGNETQVELHAESEVAIPSIFRSGKIPGTGSDTDRNTRSNDTSASHAENMPGGVIERNVSTNPPPDQDSVVIEMELRRGALAALADGETELRVRFANSVTMAKHARFAMKAAHGDYARVIVERGVARVLAGGGKEQVLPTTGQFVEINKPATGRIVTAVQPIRSSDAEAVAEMAALRFVPTLVEPAAKPPPTLADNSPASQSTASATPGTAAANGSPVNQSVSAAVSASLPPSADRSSTVQPSAVATATYGAASLGGLAAVNPLQAPANGANIKGPVNSPEHP